MRLYVREALQAPGESFPFSQEMEMSSLDVGLETLAFLEPIRLSGEITAYGDRLRLTALLTTRLEAICARCLEKAEVPVSVRLDESYAKEPDPESPDVRVYDGMVIDLDDMAEEAVRLDLPIRFLCSPECLGICPVCGANRNLSPCDCPVPSEEEGEDGGESEESPEENPLSALSALLRKDKEEV